jgi:hypothetical protein
MLVDENGNPVEPVESEIKQRVSMKPFPSIPVEVGPDGVTRASREVKAGELVEVPLDEWCAWERHRSSLPEIEVNDEQV